MALDRALDAAISGAGPMRPAARQPVIAYAFEADPQMTARSRQVRVEHRRQIVRRRVVDQLLVAQIDDEPDALPRGRLRNRRELVSEISAPVGLHGELMMMPRVRGVTASRIGSARIAKPSSGLRPHDAPASPRPA